MTVRRRHHHRGEEIRRQVHVNHLPSQLLAAIRGAERWLQATLQATREVARVIRANEREGKRKLEPPPVCHWDQSEKSCSLTRRYSISQSRSVMRPPRQRNGP